MYTPSPSPRSLKRRALAVERAVQRGEQAEHEALRDGITPISKWLYLQDAAAHYKHATRFCPPGSELYGQYLVRNVHALVEAAALQASFTTYYV